MFFGRVFFVTLLLTSTLYAQTEPTPEPTPTPEPAPAPEPAPDPVDPVMPADVRERLDRAISRIAYVEDIFVVMLGLDHAEMILQNYDLSSEVALKDALISAMKNTSDLALKRRAADFLGHAKLVDLAASDLIEMLTPPPLPPPPPPPEPQPEPTPEPTPEPIPDPQPEPQPEPTPEPQPEPSPQPGMEARDTPTYPPLVEQNITAAKAIIALASYHKLSPSTEIMNAFLIRSHLENVIEFAALVPNPAAIRFIVTTAQQENQMKWVYGLNSLEAADLAVAHYESLMDTHPTPTDLDDVTKKLLIDVEGAPHKRSLRALNKALKDMPAAVALSAATNLKTHFTLKMFDTDPETCSLGIKSINLIKARSGTVLEDFSLQPADRREYSLRLNALSAQMRTVLMPVPTAEQLTLLGE